MTVHFMTVPIKTGNR